MNKKVFDVFKMSTSQMGLLGLGIIYTLLTAKAHWEPLDVLGTSAMVGVGYYCLLVAYNLIKYLYVVIKHLFVSKD